MKRTLKLLPQPEDFIRSLAPEPRRKLLAGLRELERGEGDLRALEGALSGWYRVRIGPYRVVYRHMTGGILQCVFAERRSVVYDLFARLLAEELL